ncbi:MAG: ROK family protein [Anaerolineales bacterium]|jgi:polyphosphate glucokinase|uniref:polyphosphate--glucose phosphotransferase n=1 Tax=Candidatus Villigracilis vicinus TaxID=3140679 RepID=UPI003135AE94|nr:ROK family protein [Anaerolineales bacterium]MBK7452035.1 ROK family protein [Anaerolineales bacterium]MBK9780424.1 ROK family protein [Anaerolineales bacterium]
MQALGIDIGGSGIKGAPVDIKTGKLLADRIRIKTPEGAKPKPMAAVVAEIAQAFKWKGRIGVGFPAPIKQGIVMMAANVSQKWVGINADELLSSTTGCACRVGNDADVAGMAEMEFGAGKGQMGTVIMITLGTGIGSAIYFNGHLLPNTEFGHLQMDGKDAEHRASAAARVRDSLSWKKYAKRLNKYLNEMEKLFWPDLFIVGGGISKDHEKFLPLLELNAKIVPAQFQNEAGIVGAALFSQKR